MNCPIPDTTGWHLVPVGATIPAGTPVVTLPEIGRRVIYRPDGYPGDFHQDACDVKRWTEIPLVRPTPPTEPGTVLLDVTDNTGAVSPIAVKTAISDLWMIITDRTAQAYLDTTSLVSWTVADVVPRKADTAPDPLDENDHSPRRTRGRSPATITLRDCGKWHLGNPASRTCPQGNRSGLSCTGSSLAKWNLPLGGPLRFADEAQS